MNPIPYDLTIPDDAPDLIDLTAFARPLGFDMPVEFSPTAFRFAVEDACENTGIDIEVRIREVLTDIARFLNGSPPPEEFRMTIAWVDSDGEERPWDYNLYGGPWITVYDTFGY